MTQIHARIIALTGAVTALAVTTLGTPLTARSTQRGGGPPLWDTFRADLSIRHALVRADGQPIGPAAPAATVGMERRETGGRWKTTLTLREIARPEIRGLSASAALDNPFQVVRMEYDEDGTPPRLYDRHNRLVRLPRAEDRRVFHTPATLAAGLPVLPSLAGRVGAPPPAITGREWVEAVLASPEQRVQRRAALERRLGRATGQVRGFDRFTSHSGDVEQEILVDPNTALPVEMNTTRQGTLVARTTWAHVRDTAGQLVSRTSRTERTVQGDSGDRSVTTTTLANIQLVAGGARRLNG
jgi:hypothetical protein